MPKEGTTRKPTRGPRRAYSTGDAELDRRLNALVEELDLAPVDARSTYELLVTAIRMAEEPLSPSLTAVLAGSRLRRESQ